MVRCQDGAKERSHNLLVHGVAPPPPPKGFLPLFLQEGAAVCSEGWQQRSALCLDGDISFSRFKETPKKPRDSYRHKIP